MKKTSHSSDQDLHQPSFLDTLCDHPSVHWISNNGRTLLWILAALIVAISAIVKFFGASTNESEAPFLKAEREFRIFQNSQARNEQATSQPALEKLNTILKKYSELQQKYDGPIAQSLITTGSINEAEPYASRTLKRIEGNQLPLYSEYAKTTLAISQKQYKEALAQSLSLKQKMQDSKEGYGDILYIFSLLRIAFLSQQLGDKGHELAAWEDLTKISTTNDTSSQEMIQAVNTLFAEGKTTLQDYMQERMKALR